MRTTPRGSWRTACLILLLGLALAGCSVFQREDPRSDPSALGQAITGGEEEDEETDGGLGGTGILGAITGFGSIKVNGLRVRHASEATVLSVIGPRPVETLEVGEVLLAQAREADRGLLASRLVRYLPLVGPITALDLDTRSLRVLGVTVRVREGAVIRDRSGATLALVGLPLQGKLAVSGFWDGSAVVAHHLRVVAPELPDSVTGPVSVDAEGGLRIGGVAIEAGSAAPPVDGLALTATGQFRAGALAASRIAAGFATPLAPGIAKLSVQGYPQAETEKTETAAAVRLSGQPGIRVETGAVGRFGLFEGPVSALEGRDDRSGLPGTARSRLAERALPEISIAAVPGAIRDRLDVSRAPVGALSAGATPIGAGVVGAGVLGSGVVGTGAVGRGVVGGGAIGSGAIGDAIGAGAVSPDAAGRGARGRAGGRGRERSDDSAENGPGDTTSGPGSGRGGPASGPGSGRGGPTGGPAGGRGGPSGGPAGERGGPSGGPAGGRGGPAGGPAGGRGGPAGGPAGGRGGPSGGPSGRGGPAGGPGGRGGPGGGAGPGNR